MKHEHFWVMCAATSTTLALIVGAAGAAVAQPPSSRVTVIGHPVEEGDSVRVSYRDLNLASAKGERRLNRRVASAAQTVCEPYFSDFERTSCQDYAWTGARPQIAMAVQRAKEIAMTGTSSIPLVAIAIVTR